MAACVHAAQSACPLAPPRSGGCWRAALRRRPARVHNWPPSLSPVDRPRPPLLGPCLRAAVLERGIQEVARKYEMEWRVSFSTKQKRLALLVRCGGSRAAAAVAGSRRLAGANGAAAACSPR